MSVRVFLDTSVLVAAMVSGQPAHERALAALQRVISGEDSGVVAAHSVAELYAVLTRMPLRPPIPPSLARQLIEQNVLEACEVIALPAPEYGKLVVHLAATGVAGGATYDALILHCAAAAGVDRVLILNIRDFGRVYPSLAGLIAEPPGD